MAEAEKMLEKFRPNEPILFEEVLNIFPNRSRQWVYNTLKSLISSRRLVRFATGVYYIPKYDIFVNNRISVDKVAIKKYIQCDDDVYGYYSGMTLLYEMGIIKKKPQTITVVRQYCEYFPDIWPVIDNRKLAIYNIIKDSVKNRGKHGFVDRA